MMGDEQPVARYEGRLELTWTNKHLRLLAREDGGYEWVPTGDYRVSEIRLLHSAAAVGKTRAESSRSKDNLLIRGDALNALITLTRIPEFSREYLGKVQLIYVDPPFNTWQAFAQYDDALEHSVWLTMMRDRLVQAKKLLSPKGSIWVHCDDNEQAYLKAVMDEVFGRQNFVATIVWQKRTSRENRAAFGSAHDYIIVYSPAGPVGFRDVRNRLPSTDAGYSNPDNDPRGNWRSIPFTAMGYRKNQMYDIKTPAGGSVKPPKGRCWAATEPVYKELLADNRVYFPKRGRGRPRTKLFEGEEKGLVPMTWWEASDVGDNEDAKKEILALFPDREPFSTPKPEELLRRIIHIGSNPGEIVMDFFVGSGTTAAVAQKMGRRWVGIEWERNVVETYALPRLTMVVQGEDPGGITEIVDWKGGGGFRVLDVAPSMFEGDGGIVFLADWAVNGRLAEATAAQLGYEYIPDPPFSGRKGKSRLAVIDGLVNADVVKLLARGLLEEERVVVCGTGIDPEAREILREIRPGSSVRKIPATLLEEYRQEARWRPKDTYMPTDGASTRALVET